MGVKTKVPPCSNVHMDGAGDLALGFAEDGTPTFILEMGVVVHLGVKLLQELGWTMRFCTRQYVC